MPLPSYEKRLAERILGEEDVQRLLAAQPKSRDRILLQLLYGAGLRVSEACHLRWRNLRPRGSADQITAFGKNGRTRATSPAEQALVSLAAGAAWRAISPNVFRRKSTGTNRSGGSHRRTGGL